MATQGALPPSPALFVGVVIDEKQVAWGRCPILATPLRDYPKPLPAEETIALIHDRVAPLLQDQPAAAFRRLVTRVDALTEMAAIRRPSPQREEREGFSRRALLTGRLGADRNGPPATEKETIERPLHPSLRHGVSVALLGAAALATGVTMAEVLASAYDLPRPATAATLHSRIGTRTATTVACAHRVASLGTSWPGDDPVAELGRNGEQLQRYVRRLAHYLESTAGAAYRPVIHLDLGGGFGPLYDDNAGRILGALAGLEQATSPYPVRVVDPVRQHDQDAQIEKMAELKEYLRLRQMSLELAAHTFVETPADALTFASNGSSWTRCWPRASTARAPCLAAPATLRSVTWRWPSGRRVL
jgi:methylaspartate ammonia-lyase